MSKLNKLLSGQGIMIKDDDIVDACHHFPNMSPATMKKLEKAYNKGKAARLKLTEDEMVGNGLGVPKIVKKVGRVARKTGQAVMKSGVGDVLIDEAVGVLPMPTIAQKVVSGVIKKQAHELTGTGLNTDASQGTSAGMSRDDIQSNPYIPQSLKGSGLQKYGYPIETHNNSSNLVHIHSDAFHPDYKLSNAYSNPVGHAYRTDMK